jgi:hypothetical protein
MRLVLRPFQDGLLTVRRSSAMPFTPFHFGPGLFLKGVISRWLSWITFVAVQIVIDCETLYYILRHEYPVHRRLHTIVGATLIGIAVAAVLLACRWFVERLKPELAESLRARWPSLRSEGSAVGIVTGAIIGGASHPLLDGLMHPDIRPFAPWTSANPLLGAVELSTLLSGCVVSGIIGFVVVGIWLYAESRAG